MFLNFYENFETQFWWSLNHIHKHPQAKMLLQHLLGAVLGFGGYWYGIWLCSLMVRNLPPGPSMA